MQAGPVHPRVDVTTVVDATAADEKLRDREAYGAFVLGPGGLSGVHVASAASPVAAQLLAQVGQTPPGARVSRPPSTSRCDRDLSPRAGDTGGAVPCSGDRRVDPAVAGGLPRSGDHRLPHPRAAGRRRHRQHPHRLPACLGEDQADTSAVLLSASASARHARTGDHEAALAHAEAGLALYEAAESGDTGYDDPVSALRAERASTQRSLARARALALSRLGRRAEAAEALTELVAERPRDEEVLLELLRCEAATAGPSSALARYDAYRRSLRDELGSDPGPALQALHRQLLQGEAPAVRHGIPHEPNPLLGRADDLAAVTNLLRTSRVTSIVGPGGLGKTRLAQVVSRQAEQRVVHFVTLVGVTTADDVVSEVASALGVGESRRAPVSNLGIPPDVLAGIVNALGPGPALLVLDNCEHVIHGAAELVRALVSMTRDLRVLTTSRAPLSLSSESVYLLPELSLATTVELFEQRARAVRPGADLPAKVVEELCGHLDGLPLAVELAAARIRVMSVAEIARRLVDRFALLRGVARDAPERHRTLHAVVDWSWTLLEPAGQAAMRALSVFPGGFTADAAGHLLGDDEVLRVLEHLVDQSLLKVTDTPSGTRFGMLETLLANSSGCGGLLGVPAACCSSWGA